MDKGLLEQFDRLIKDKGYGNRSKAICDLVREKIVEEEWKFGNKKTAGTVTIVYNHHTREITDNLTHLQHDYYSNIISNLHIHLDAHNCLEVLVLKGKAKKIKRISDKIIASRGVKHGRLTMTTTGKRLP
jgi:CopG family nickel-responsive transcriptional regulator